MPVDYLAAHRLYGVRNYKTVSAFPIFIDIDATHASIELISHTMLESSKIRLQVPVAGNGAVLDYLHCPVLMSHCAEAEARPQSHGVQPPPDARPQWLGAHWSHVAPMTPERHTHPPVAGSQWSIPNSSHTHAGN